MPSGKNALHLGPVTCVDNTFVDDTQCDVVRAGLMSFFSLLNIGFFIPCLLAWASLINAWFCLPSSSWWTSRLEKHGADLVMQHVSLSCTLALKGVGSEVWGSVYIIFLWVWTRSGWPSWLSRPSLCWGGVGGGGWYREREAAPSFFHCLCFLVKKNLKLYV